MQEEVAQKYASVGSSPYQVPWCPNSFASLAMHPTTWDQSPSSNHPVNPKPHILKNIASKSYTLNPKP